MRIQFPSGEFPFTTASRMTLDPWASSPVGNGRLFPWWPSNQSMKFTTHLYLVLRFRMHGSILSLPHFHCLMLNYAQGQLFFTGFYSTIENVDLRISMCTTTTVRRDTSQSSNLSLSYHTITSSSKIRDFPWDNYSTVKPKIFVFSYCRWSFSVIKPVNLYPIQTFACIWSILTHFNVYTLYLLRKVLWLELHSYLHNYISLYSELCAS
jgi:hypothetical protein